MRIWQEFLNIVREESGSPLVETWFKAVELKKWDTIEKIAYLQAPNAFVQEWIINHYMHLFIRHLGRLLNESSLSIKFVQENNVPLPMANSLSPLRPAQLYEAPAGRKISPQKVAKIYPNPRDPLNNNYLFENFIVGPSNELAYAAAYAITENPGKLYNPLFIYGGSGLGKTHLLHAIGNTIKQKIKKVRIVYQSADRFIQEFINAIRFNRIYQFETKYKDVDILLVDDIQFISHKEQTQEAFFHIFNTLYQSQKQIVVSSDSMPKDIVGLADRMRSRLDGGLIADIQPPSLETRIAILKKKAENHQISLSDTIAHTIACAAYLNIRELEGALIRIIAFTTLTHQEITIDLVKKILTQAPPEHKKNFDLPLIAQHISRHFSYSLEELRSSNRNKKLTLARHIAMYFMKKHTECSLREIGTFFARRDHSTVIHAFEKIEAAKKKDKSLCEKLSRLEEEMQF